MKIKRITLKDYGPIKDFSLQPGDFELIFGLNESGKTAIVEALSYVLFRTDVRGLRYGKPDDISVEIESSDKSYTVPAKKLAITLPAGELANLLYIQASDSLLYKKESETKFWDGIKLMLSRVGQKVPFVKLGEKVLENAGLTAKARWKENKQKSINEKIDRKLKLETYIKEISDIENKRLEFFRIKEEHEKLKRELKIIEDFKNYKNYKELLDLYTRYTDKKNSLEDYLRYEESYLEKWQRLEAEKIVKASLARRLKEDEEVIRDLEKNLNELKRTEKMIADGEFKKYLTGPKELPKKPTMFYFPITFLAGLLALILSFRFKFTIVIPLVLFALGIAFFAYFQYKKAKIRKCYLEKEMWLNKAKLVFPDVGALSLLPQKIETIEKEIIRCETLISEKKKIKDDFGSDITIEEIEKNIKELRDKTGLSEWSQIKKKIDEKNTIKRDLDGLGAQISSLLFEKDNTKWKRLIDERRVEPPEKKPDLSLAEEKNRKFTKLKECLEELEKEIKFFEELKQRQFNISDAHQAFVELARLKDELNGYELEQQAALRAYEIFNEMSGELDNFIEGVISGDDSLSQYFSQITERYRTVKVIDQDFVVIERDGQEFKSLDLSSGALDQLLLCFRLAALKRIYPEGSFLILDDGFIFADWPRRHRLVALLKIFIQDGNQVIYLTSDDHTRNLFKEFGARITTI